MAAGAPKPRDRTAAERQRRRRQKLREARTCGRRLCVTIDEASIAALVQAGLMPAALTESDSDLAAALAALVDWCAHPIMVRHLQRGRAEMAAELFGDG